jgi:RNA polymerase sigma-70 factor (ECF subfamily)
MGEQTPGSADALQLHLVVLRCQAGDEQAFAQLFERFGGRTLAYLGGLVGGDAADVQQEVWLAVYRGLRGLSNPRAFRTWLFQTTRHRAIDFLRKRKRELELIAGAAAESAAAQGAWDEPDETAEAPILPEIMAMLAPAHREVLLLRFQDGMSYAEIALVVGCSIGTVRSRLHHAKRRAQELATPRRG